MRLRRSGRKGAEEMNSLSEDSHSGGKQKPTAKSSSKCEQQSSAPDLPKKSVISVVVAQSRLKSKLTRAGLLRLCWWWSFEVVVNENVLLILFILSKRKESLSESHYLSDGMLPCKKKEDTLNKNIKIIKWEIMTSFSISADLMIVFWSKRLLLLLLMLFG